MFILFGESGFNSHHSLYLIYYIEQGFKVNYTNQKP
uniref:Uncharacterized protein n=1 Tax=Myoviridae sp. ctNQV2 TaxID=2827683 RepID=A0A8S5RYI0_9CAUD|nr:MAG TPA: hypothetical protein [Myoviridae sp. ctNQV2]